MLYADVSSIGPDWLLNMAIFICAAAAVCGGAAAVWSAWFKKPAPVPAVPQPLVTQKAVEYASAEGVRKLAAELDSLRKEVQSQRSELAGELAEMEQRLAAAGETRVVAIHNRINPLAQEVHTVRGAVNEMSATLHDLAGLIRNERKR